MKLFLAIFLGLVLLLIIVIAALWDHQIISSDSEPHYVRPEDWIEKDDD